MDTERERDPETAALSGFPGSDVPPQEKRRAVADITSINCIARVTIRNLLFAKEIFIAWLLYDLIK